MDLLSRPEADHFLYAIGPNGCGYIGYFVRWDFGDEDLTTPGVFQCVQNHIHSIFQSDCKTSHIGMGDWQDPLFSFFYKEGNDRSVCPHNVPISKDREGVRVSSTYIVGRCIKFIVNQ